MVPTSLDAIEGYVYTPLNEKPGGIDTTEFN